MSIEYKILWVNDSPDWVEPVSESIKAYLEERGYTVVLLEEEDGNKIDNHLQLTDIDLIVIDYHLPDKNGDELISHIRETECLTEIVFYSQDVAPQDVIGSLDGIYHCMRDDAEDYIKKIIDLTLKKAQDLTLIRGYIIAETIDIENILEEYMSKVFEGKSDVFSELVINAKPPVYDSNKKYVFVKRIVDELKKKEDPESDLYKVLDEIEKIMRKLSAEVFDKRNILGHARRTVNTDGEVILEGVNNQTKEIVFSQEWLSSTRTDILKHKQNLIRLREYI